MCDLDFVSAVFSLQHNYYVIADKHVQLYCSWLLVRCSKLFFVFRFSLFHLNLLLRWSTRRTKKTFFSNLSFQTGAVPHQPFLAGGVVAGFLGPVKRESVGHIIFPRAFEVLDIRPPGRGVKEKFSLSSVRRRPRRVLPRPGCQHSWRQICENYLIAEEYVMAVPRILSL